MISRLITACLLAFSAAGLAQAQFNDAQIITNQLRAESDREFSFQSATKLSLNPDKIKNASRRNERGFGGRWPDDMEVGDSALWDEYSTVVKSIIDDSNCIIQVGQTLVWLSDYPTEKLVDDQEIRILDPVKLGEPKQYKATSGKLVKIRSASLLPLDKQDAWLAEQRKKYKLLMAEQAEIARRYQEAESQRLEAILEEKKRSAIHLKLKNGEEVWAKALSSKDGKVYITDIEDQSQTLELKELTIESTKTVRTAMAKAKKAEDAKKKKP